MTTIAIDIDDTLTSFQDTARAVFIDLALERGDKRLQRGAYCAWGEWRSPADVTDDDSWPQVIARCHSSAHIAAQIPFPGAVDVLRELAAQEHELHYISNRKPEAWQDTYDWLGNNGFPLDGHRLTCQMENKVKRLFTAQYLIDDRPKTLIEFVYDFGWKNRHGSEYAAKARKGFGLYMPYNAALTDVPGIKLAPNWKLLHRYLIEQDVVQAGGSYVGIPGR